MRTKIWVPISGYLDIKNNIFKLSIFYVTCSYYFIIKIIVGGYMSQIKRSCDTNRREFFKKSLYSAPVVLALGHLAPSMVYGADSGFVEKSEAVAIVATVAAEGPAPVPGAGSGSGSGNTGSGVIGSSTDGGGSSTGGAGDGSQALPTDNNQTN